MDTEILAKLIDAKHDCLGQLLDVGERQAQLIEEGRMTALLNLLATKQKLLEQLQKIEAALDPFRQESPEQRRWDCPATRQRCVEQLQQCEQRLAEVIRREKQCEATLNERRQRLGARLDNANHAGTACAAYLSGPSLAPGQLDVSTG